MESSCPVANEHEFVLGTIYAGLWKAKMLKSAKILNSGFWKAKVFFLSLLFKPTTNTPTPLTSIYKIQVVVKTCLSTK